MLEISNNRLVKSECIHVIYLFFYFYHLMPIYECAANGKIFFLPSFFMAGANLVQ